MITTRCIFTDTIIIIIMESYFHASSVITSYIEGAFFHPQGTKHEGETFNYDSLNFKTLWKGHLIDHI